MANNADGLFGAMLTRVATKFVPEYWRNRQEREEARAWVAMGRPSRPPHAVKAQAVKEYAARFEMRILVETGTYEGAMIDACKGVFARIYSVELSKTLFQKASERFFDDSNVRLLQGDSSEVLPGLLSEIREPCLFWLDAHYSGGITAQGKELTPIFQELETIFDDRTLNHVILIDDARDFVGIEGYPTIAELKAFVMMRRPNWSFDVRDDIVRIHA